MSFIKRKIEDMTKVPDSGLYRIYKDRWWATDGENILFYKGYYSPQCNKHESIARQLSKKHGGNIKFLQKVFVPHDCKDYL